MLSRAEAFKESKAENTRRFSTKNLLSEIEAEIVSQVNDGSFSLTFCVERYSQESVDKVLYTIYKNGYNNAYCENGYLNIRWDK